MRFYELTYLSSLDLSEEGINNLKEKITSFLEKEGGVLDEAKSPVKKILGYPIKKKTAVFLTTLNFHSNPDQKSRFEQQLKSESEILRYLILAKSKPSKTEETLTKRIRKLKKPSVGHIPVKKPKVEFKEIEKKLEEILGE